MSTATSSQENKMGTQPILRLIISMSVPAMFSMLVQALYNIIDSVFVAKLGQDALTAVSLAFPVQMLVISVAVGTGIGVNSLVSRRLGEKRQEEANSAATHGLVRGFFSWVAFALLGIFFTRFFFECFTDNEAIVQMGCDYIYVVTICSFGSFLQIMAEKVLQATGNMFYPMVFQLIGAITNIILDPIMIFGLLGFPKLGVLGAAIATVTGQIVAMLYSFYIIFRKSHGVHITFKHFRLRGEIVKDIYAVGVPSIIMQSIGSVLTTCLNMILISFSDAAVSVLGVYYKIQSFVFMPVFGLTHGVMPIMGYNYGARNKKRLMEALKWGIIISVGIMFLGTLIFLLFPAQLLGIFSATQEMLDIGVHAFRAICLCFLSAGVCILFSTLFQAMGQGGKSLAISVLRQLVLLLPAAYLLSKVGLFYVWYAFPLAEYVSLAACILLFVRLYKKQIARLEGSSFTKKTAEER